MNNNKNIPKDSPLARCSANDVDFNKRPITKENNPMEHTQKQLKRKYMNQKPWYADYSQDSLLPCIGFDNTDKNKLRNSIGSCTDMIAAERRLFGPWQVPHAGRQQKLVNRLAPHKPPAPPDPRFDSWMNHFQRYWDIGVDVKPTRKSLQKSSNTAIDLKVISSTSEDPSEHNRGRLYVTSYHRLLKRQSATLLKLPAADSQDENQMDSVGESGQVSEKFTNNTLGRNHGANYSRRNQGSDYDRRTLVPGLDRRYMGLQTTDKRQLDDMVRRLTRMTSAYSAKFSPNPHVWIDTAPGAHMVIKRENTIG